MKFIESLSEKIIEYMHKDFEELKVEELHLIDGLFDLHEDACEFLERQGKYEKHDAAMPGAMGRKPV